MSNPNFISYICRKDILRATWIPTYKLPKLSGYAIGCWGYKGSIISHPKLANPTSSCIHPSTHNQETFGNHLPQPSKSIHYTSHGNTPVLTSVLGYRGYLTNELHKRDFRCRRTKLRYSRTATIKLWRQHLRAQLPGTLPQPLNVRRHHEQSSRHKTIRTIPRYPRDPKKIVKFEKRRVKTLRQDALPERWGDWGVKRIPKLSDI